MNVNTGGYGACTYMSEEGKHLRLATATVVFRHIHDRTQLTRTFLRLIGSLRLIPITIHFRRDEAIPFQFREQRSRRCIKPEVDKLSCTSHTFLSKRLPKIFNSNNFLGLDPIVSHFFNQNTNYRFAND